MEGILAKAVGAVYPYDIHQLKYHSYIREAMDIQNFLNPVEEVIQDSPEQLEEHILAQFEPEVEQESDEEIEQLPRVTADEALEALAKLQLHEEQSEEGNPSLITQLGRHERVLQSSEASKTKAAGYQSLFREYLVVYTKLQHCINIVHVIFRYNEFLVITN
jgi:hypothetical protein